MCPESGRTDGDEWKKLDEALRGLLPLSKEVGATARERLVESRLQGRQIIHGAKIRREDGRCVWSADGKARWRTLRELLDQLVEDHKIDRDVLVHVVDTAALLYRGDPLHRADVERLLTAIRTVTAMSLWEDHHQSITGVLTDRYDSFIKGRIPWDVEDVRTAIAVRMWLGRIGQGLRLIEGDLFNLQHALEHALPKLPATKRTDKRLHVLVKHLERYWEKLPGKKLSKTFPSISKKVPPRRLLPYAGKERALKNGAETEPSEAVRFIKAVVTFIDPDAAAKLPSVMKHRLKRN
jgi:hypothetical protein